MTITDSAGRTKRQTPQATRGMTLLECLVSLAIVLVLLSTAIPPFAQALERRHLEGVAAQLATDIQHTRSLAVASNGGMRLSFRNGAAGSCYVVHSGPVNACSCNVGAPTQCSPGNSAIRTVTFDADAHARVHANVGSILFHPVHGTSTPTGTLRVVARSGAAVHQIVNIMGRTRACSPNGVPGYPAC